MSNMYGYSDYQGPLHHDNDAKTTDHAQNNDDDDDNPLQTGFWLEGDSLAPPLGTEIHSVRKILEYAKVGKHDVVYDLGCGDGRVCLEAYNMYKCRTVGVEVESDLVERAQYLIAQLKEQLIQNEAGDNADASSNDVDEVDTLSKLPVIINCDLRDVVNELVEAVSSPQSDTTTMTIQLDKQQVTLPIPTVIVLYLLPEALDTLQDQFIRLLNAKSDLRIVCNTWGLTKLKAAEKYTIDHANGAMTDILVYNHQSVANI